MAASCNSRQGYSHERSYNSGPTSPSSRPRQTIRHQRTASRTSSDSRAPFPPTLDGLASLFQSRASSPFPPTSTPGQGFSVPSGGPDAERWERMLALQREFHCYNSARLEAAVEALENGWPIERVPIRESTLCIHSFNPLATSSNNALTAPKLCLDLLNEELKAQIEAGNVPC